VINQNQVYINGQFVDAITAERIDVSDPATSDVIARVPNAVLRSFGGPSSAGLKPGFGQPRIVVNKSRVAGG